MLPFLTGSKAKREMQREFRGLNRRPGAAENEFAAMENMTGAGYPLLASRSPRGRVRKLTKINGMLGGAQLCFVDGTDFFYEGACYGQVTDGEKLLVRMGGKILIFPDKLAFDTETYSFSPLENHVALTGVTLAPTFSDGTALGSVTESGTQPGQPQDGMLWLDTRSHTLRQYSAAQEQWAEVTGTRVALRGTGIGAGFRAGDGVRVSGTGVEELEGILLLEEATENEVVVTGLMARGKVISGQVTLDRDVPDLVLATELNNRLWGVEEGSQELLAIAVILALLLAQDQDSGQLGRMSAFFTVLGDILALFALQPDFQAKVIRHPWSPPSKWHKKSPDFSRQKKRADCSTLSQELLLLTDAQLQEWLYS